MKNFQNQATILLIESNSDWLAEVRAMLWEAGYNVLTADGGDQGFCVARRAQPDLIICEAALPDFSGVQLCYMIRADSRLRRVPLILLGETCGQPADSAAEALRAGADDCFETKCCRQFLATKIARLIALRRSEIELLRRRQTLHRAESRLAKIIEETSNLVAALDPAYSSAALNSYDALRLKSFFGAARSSRKPPLKKNANALEIWKPTVRAADFVETGKGVNEKREKVFYEIVC